MILLSLCSRMSEPPTLSFDLEIASGDFPNGNNLTLDLWKGFSAPIGIVVTDPNPPIADEDVEWYYSLSMFCAKDGPLVVLPRGLGCQLNPSQALSTDLLLIQDAHGNKVPIEGWSAWEHTTLCHGYMESCLGGRMHHPLATASPGLLKQLRRRLRPGSTYTLRFKPKSYPVWLITIEPKYIAESAQICCSSNTVQFKVVGGTPIPRFSQAFSLSSSTYHMRGKRGLTLTQTTTCLAKRPVKLALIDSSYKENQFEEVNIDWSYNGFPFIFHFNLHGRAFGGQAFGEERKRVRECHHTMSRATSETRVEHGKYRCALESSNGEAKVTTTSIPQQPSPINEEGLPLGLQQYVLCPGDKLIQQYHFDQGILDALVADREYELIFKYNRCHYWTYVADAEVLNDSPVEPSAWPDHGPIWCEPVNPVASVIEQVFERSRPEAFFKLPSELRQQVYTQVRTRQCANSVRFQTTGLLGLLAQGMSKRSVCMPLL